MSRFALIARLLSARVVVVENPVFSLRTSRLLPSERLGLRSGDFGPLAARMFDTASPVLSDVEDGRLSFLGYSLGASIVTAMAGVATEREWAVEQLILVEPVGLREWNAGSLLTASLLESHWDSAYRGENPTFPEMPQLPFRGSDLRWAALSDQLLLGSALRRGGIQHDVLTMTPPPHRTTVVRAAHSRLSARRSSGNRADWGQDGQNVRILTVPGHHGFWHSLPAVEAMTQRLALAINGCRDPASA